MKQPSPLLFGLGSECGSVLSDRAQGSASSPPESVSGGVLPLPSGPVVGVDELPTLGDSPPDARGAMSESPPDV